MHSIDPAKLVGVIIACSSVLFTSFFFMDTRHAQAEEHAKLAEEHAKLKRYTVYSLKEVELDSYINRLELFRAVPQEMRREYHEKEIMRLTLKVQSMQVKLGAAPNE
jgi:hypothetical protein